MDTIDYSIRVFSNHIKKINYTECISGSTVLELGPGDSVATSLIAKSYGARSILIDSSQFATEKMITYQSINNALPSFGMNSVDISSCCNLREMLDKCDSKYLTDGLNSLKQIPDNSVDIIFSQSVLQHIRRSEFTEIQRNLYRILKPGGHCSHVVDLRDCLGGGLNNLRFPGWLWEASLFSGSGFYTNRIRYKEMLDIITQVGFQVSESTVQKWESLPMDRSLLSKKFRSMSSEDLLTFGFHAVLKKC